MPAEKKALPLAGNLRILRRELQLSQAALGAHVGLTRSNIASYENAKAEPRAAKLAEFARFFNVSLERLITGDFSDRDTHPAGAGRRGRPPGSGKRPLVAPAPRADLREHLAGFEERNGRLKQLLSELAHYVHTGGTAQDQADLRSIALQFEHVLAVMRELLRNDEALAGVLEVVSATAPPLPAAPTPTREREPVPATASTPDA